MLDGPLDDQRNPIDDLAEEFAQRCRSGGCPSVAIYAERYPHLADEIRELFPAIAMMEQLSRQEETLRSDTRRHTGIDQHLLDRLGDYHIVRVIGRGGMGVVYEAVQESLGRSVALKVLTANVSDHPRQLKRFTREAQAAAMLHHTNIVPVVGVGCDEGLHYYVMQYIDGVSFDRLIDQQSDEAVEGNPTQGVPTGTLETEAETAIEPLVDSPRRKIGPVFTWQQIAAFGVQIARAVDYAHCQGILHRDIKPANLLLDEHETVWVTDFGLAKVFGEDGLTRSGDVFGTLRYMAPEQFEGRSHEASDIYSIALTLYELVTGQPAFTEEDAKRMIARITQQGVPRPRQLAPAIPADLETIILKGAAFDPSHRYRTAGELADDLQRFLDGEPIVARRTSSLRRAWRWSRRNPALAILSSISVILLLLVAIVSAIGYVHMAHARQQAVAWANREQTQATQLRLAHSKVLEETEHARREYQRAEDNLQLAMRAFEDVMEHISSRGLPESLELDLNEDTPRTPPAAVTGDDAELLQSLLVFYQEFAERNSADAGVHLETAKAHHRIGDIRQRLGQFDLAATAYAEALRIYRDMTSAGSHDLTLLLATVEASNQRGVTLSRAGHMREAIEVHMFSRDLLTRQPATLRDTTACRFALAETCIYLGAIWARDDAVTAPLLVRGGGARGGLARSGAGRGGPGPGNAAVRSNAASWMKENQETALAILNDLIAQDPTNGQYRLALARCHRNFLPWTLREGHAADAARNLQTSIQILEQLVADYPDTPSYSYELADVSSIDPPTLWNTAFGQQSRQRLERAEQISRKLTSAFPNQPQYELLHANALYRLGLVLRRKGESDLAIRFLAESLQRLQGLLDRFPDVPVYVASLCQVTDDLGTLQREAGSLEDSRETLESGILRLLATYDPAGDLRASRRWMATLHSNLNRTLAAANP